MSKTETFMISGFLLNSADVNVCEVFPNISTTKVFVCKTPNNIYGISAFVKFFRTCETSIFYSHCWNLSAVFVL